MQSFKSLFVFLSLFLSNFNLFSQASLPISGVITTSVSPLPTGFTASGTGSYSSNFTKLKFENPTVAGVVVISNLILNFTGTPGTLTYLLTGNGLSDNTTSGVSYVFDVQESSDGSTWTALKSHTSSTNTPVTNTSFTASPSSATRYIRWIYTTKALGNIGLGTISLTAGATTPALSVTPSSRTGFSYILGSGPSSSQTFSVSGSNLTADISLAAPTNYEISSDNTTFSSSLTLTQSSGTVAATTVYARLKSGLSVASYNSETVSITSTGATSSSVSLSGSVAAPTPTLSVTPSSLTGFTYIAGNGPSSSQTFSVSGADLTADISLTAPTNYEISSDNTTFGSSLSLAQSGGTVAATTVYARLKSGLSAANYNSETVSIASTGATSSTVSLSGSVAAPTITVTPTSLTGFNYASGSGPSSSQTFSVSGTNLTANISLTAPTNYEISSDNTTFSSSLTLTQSGNAVAATTIYARLKSGLSIASYNSETVSLTSTGATNSTVSLSGSVSSTSTIASGEIALRTQFVNPCGNDGRNEFIIITTAKAFDVNKLAFGSDGVGDTNFNFWWAGKDAATPTGYTVASAVTSFAIADPTAVTPGGDYDASGNKTSERTAYLNSVAGCTVFQDVPSDGVIPANKDFIIFLGGAGDGVASGTLTTDGFHNAPTNMNFSTHCASGSAVQQYYAVYGKSNNTTGYFANEFSRVSTIWYQNGSSASAAGMSKINEVTYDPTDASGSFAILTDGTILDNLGGTGGACIPVPSAILLPIELLYFNVSKNDSKVLLNWATATEKNNSHFIVERSADGVHFSEIGVVAGNGTTYSTQNYQFTDSQKSLSVNTYYRLKQVDFDGTTSYSSIKVVKNVTNKSPQIDILGNPVSNSINFNLYNFSSEANVKLINLMGQQVIEYQANPAQTTHTLNIASLPKGYYTLVISGSDLEATKVEKIIVQN